MQKINKTLFEKLSEEDDFVEVGQSVVNEVARLLSTRRFLRSIQPSGLVIDYGLPTFADFYSEASHDTQTIAQYIRESILQFEPRIHHVDVIDLETETQELSIKLRLDLADQVVEEQFTFS